MKIVVMLFFIFFTSAEFSSINDYADSGNTSIESLVSVNEMPSADDSHECTENCIIVSLSCTCGSLNFQWCPCPWTPPMDLMTDRLCYPSILLKKISSSY